MKQGEPVPDRFLASGLANFVCSFVCTRARGELANAADFCLQGQFRGHRVLTLRAAEG